MMMIYVLRRVVSNTIGGKNWGRSLGVKYRLATADSLALSAHMLLSLEVGTAVTTLNYLELK